MTCQVALPGEAVVAYYAHKRFGLLRRTLRLQIDRSFWLLWDIRRCDLHIVDSRLKFIQEIRFNYCLCIGSGSNLFHESILNLCIGSTTLVCLALIRSG